MQKRFMLEHEVLAYVSEHLRSQERAILSSLSVKCKHRPFVTRICKFNFRKSQKDKLPGCKERNNPYVDIIARYPKSERKICIECKGGNPKYAYNLYTVIGQFVTIHRGTSCYDWFGIALPLAWKPYLLAKFANSEI